MSTGLTGTHCHHNRVTLKDFKFLKCIGVGGFSRVYLVKKKSTGRIFAMKLIDKEFILKNRKQGTLSTPSRHRAKRA
jgi:serine/threonine protein kinase